MAKEGMQAEEEAMESCLPEPNGEAGTDLERLERKLEATRDQLLRTLADFDNYRRRIDREAQSIGQSGKRDLILGVLTVLDSFDQAIALGSDDSQSGEGLVAIQRQLLKVLAAHGVVPFDSHGAPFDPSCHEAVGTVDAAKAGVDPGVILDEYQKGYTWGDQLLRPARVQVAQ